MSSPNLLTLPTNSDYYPPVSPHHPSQNSPRLPLPLTPRNDGEIRFIGPETVKYISPPRFVQTHSQHDRNISPPTYSQCVAPPAPPPAQHPQNPYYPMIQPQPYGPMYTSPPSMFPVCAPPMAQPMMMMQPAMPMMMQQQQQSPPSINVVVNSTPPTTVINNNNGKGGGSSGGGGGALICPKCRKGVIGRKQDKRRKMLLICLAICCVPLTCCIPLCCLCCNYVDTCQCCGKVYGHRGRKTNTKINAVHM